MMILIKVLRLPCLNHATFAAVAGSSSEDSKPTRLQNLQDSKRPGLPTIDHFAEVLKMYPRLHMHSPSTWSSISGTLFAQGFSTKKMNKMFLKTPQLLDVNTNDISRVLKLFRECKLGEKNLLMMIYENPELLCLDPVSVSTRLDHLFTIVPRKDITKILERGLLSVFIEPWESTLEKLQYVDSAMGQDQRQMINANVFRYSLNFIKMRHAFFVRTGKYKKPNPKLYNPKELTLKVIVGCSEENIPKFTGVSIKEYYTFQKLHEEELEQERIESEYNSDEDYDK